MGRLLTLPAVIVACTLVFCIDKLDSRNIDGFIEWVKNGSGHVSNHVVITDCGEMEYGIKSVTNIETGQLIVHIPLSLLINIEHAVTSEEAGPVLDGLEYLSDTNAMALFVAYERQRGNSQWQPFLDVMPSQFSTSLYMTDGSRNELTGSMFLEFADRRNRAVDKVQCTTDCPMTC